MFDKTKEVDKERENSDKTRTLIEAAMRWVAAIPQVRVRVYYLQEDRSSSYSNPRPLLEVAYLSPAPKSFLSQGRDIGQQWRHRHQVRDGIP